MNTIRDFLKTFRSIGSVIGVLLFLSSCNASTKPIPTEIPLVKYGISEPDCDALAPPGPPSWSFDGIVINLSTTQDVMDKYGAPENVDSPGYTRSPCVQWYAYHNYNLEFWLINNVVTQIDLTLNDEVLPDGWMPPSGLPHTLSDAKAIYGIPDIIGFAAVSSSRSSHHVIWSQRGVRAIVWLNYSGASFDQSEIWALSFTEPHSHDKSPYLFGYSVSKTLFGIVPEGRNPFDRWRKWPLEEEVP